MKTTQEIKKEILEQYGYTSFSHIAGLQDQYNELEEIINKVIYQCCEEQKFICYNEAYIIDDPDYIGTYYPPQIISKDSIIDCPNAAETN